jgi:hypothetical protein
LAYAAPAARAEAVLAITAAASTSFRIVSIVFSFLIGLPTQVAIATLQQHVGADGQFRGLFQPSGREEVRSIIKVL